MIEAVANSLETDVPQTQVGPLARLILDLNKERIHSQVLAQEEKDKAGLLLNPPISDEHDKQWVLVPRSGSWEETQKWVVCLSTKGDCPIKETPIGR